MKLSSLSWKYLCGNGIVLTVKSPMAIRKCLKNNMPEGAH